MHSDTTAALTIDYRGHADSVRLATWMPRFHVDTTFDRVDDGWRLRLDLPSTARIEYRIDIERDGRYESILDPMNPQIATNPFGRNSVLAGPDYALPEWIARTPAHPGSLAELRVMSRILGGRRSIQLYRPFGLLDDVEAPLLIVFDGSDYAEHADLIRCFDVLIADGEVPPFRAVLSDPRKRHDEYIGSSSHASCILSEVIPHVRRRVAVRGLATMGASLGGVAAWTTAAEDPGDVLGVVMHSGTLVRSDHTELDDRMIASISDFVDQALEDPLPSTLAVFQSCGRYESLIDWNREVSSELGSGRARYRYVETWTGHDWGAWRDQIAPGLRLVLGSTTAQVPGFESALAEPT